MGDISARAVETLRKADLIACEDTRETGKLCAAHGISTRKIPYHDHNAADMRPRIIRAIREGKRVALVSDAGTPLVSDPGYKLVEACAEEGLRVTCLPGPSAPLAALVLSGLPTDRFFFAGFLPPKSGARKTALKEVRGVPGTLLFFETAPRLAESLKDMVEILGDRRAAVARELTKKFEEVRRDTLSNLAAHYEEAGPPRGEIVIAIAPPAAEKRDIDLDALLAKALETSTLKDAAARVAAETGLPRKEVYARALQLKGPAHGRE